MVIRMAPDTADHRAAASNGGGAGGGPAGSGASSRAPSGATPAAATASASQTGAGPAASPPRSAPPAVEELELELLLEAIFQLHGYDFRGYERAVLRRKLKAVMTQLGAATLSALQDQVLHDAAAAAALLRALYVTPTALFDDPQEVALLRISLGVCLHGAALPRVWLADCAGAQQAWTMAILLEQEQLGAHTEIYATVASDELLAEAQEARLTLVQLAQLQLNYEQCGGTGPLRDYFVIEGEYAMLAPHLRSRITWAQYNLVTDASFNEFQMILCRRALADFGPVLRQRVLRLFHDSLAPFGVLAIDRPLEAGDALAESYQSLLPPAPWYKRIA